jgi:outer membrane protein assembly factor BamA
MKWHMKPCSDILEVLPPLRLLGTSVDPHRILYSLIPFSMREASGHSFKSSLSHTWVRDTRDDRVIGTHGLYAKVHQEIAGIGGDAKFHKFEAEGQLSRSLCPGAV